MALNFAKFVKDIYPGFQALQAKGTFKRSNEDLYYEIKTLTFLGSGQLSLPSIEEVETMPVLQLKIKADEDNI